MVIPHQTATDLREKRRVAGRLGGLQTALRYSKEQRVEWSKLGGRPRLPDIDELRQQSTPTVQVNNNGGSKLPNGLKELKELYRLRKGRVF